MKKLKIKKQNGVAGKERMEIQNKRIADNKVISYLYFDEEFSLKLPIRSLFKIYRDKKCKEFKRH